MSVIIRGMKMPKNCTECSFFVKSNSPKYPFVDCKLIGRLGSVFNCIGIPVDCPLVELPPHGRLIDGDRLHKQVTKFTGLSHWVAIEIKQAPTIIEAEGEP